MLLRPVPDVLFNWLCQQGHQGRVQFFAEPRKFCLIYFPDSGQYLPVSFRARGKVKGFYDLSLLPVAQQTKFMEAIRMHQLALKTNPCLMDAHTTSLTQATCQRRECSDRGEMAWFADLPNGTSYQITTTDAWNFDIENGLGVTIKVTGPKTCEIQSKLKNNKRYVQIQRKPDVRKTKTPPVPR